MQLNNSNLPHLAVPKPLYSRVVSPSTKRICHVGVGQFHRSHQALYLHQLLNEHALTDPSRSLDWTITGIGLLSYDVDMKAKLQQQDYLFSLLTLAENVQTVEVVGSLTDFLVIPTDGAEKVIESLAHPQTKIVSLTITEHGYLQNPALGLDFNHEKVQHDLTTPHQPQTIYGLLYSALKLRQARGLAPFTILSCDNLPANGKLTQKLVMQFLRHLDKPLANWVETFGRFPSTMVDRITPKTTEQHYQILKEDFGIEDRWPVAAEDFLQWVIEDNFVNNERPAWNEVGATFTDNVMPFEELKLYLLNAGHSTLAYPSLLLGIEIVDEGMRHPQVKEAVLHYMQEAKHAVPDNIPGVNKEEYIQTLVKRFSNPNIRDHTMRLAGQGYAKIQSFFVPAIQHLLQQPEKYSTKAMCRMIASWIVFLGTTEKHHFAIEDAKASEIVPLATLVCATMNEGERFAVLRKFMAVGIPQLANNDSFLQQVYASLSDFSV